MASLIVLAVVLLLLVFVWRKVVQIAKVSGLSQKHVLISGCDVGFGYQLTLKLLEHNIPVFSGCFTPEGERNLKKHANRLPGTLYTFPLDVRSQKSVDDAAVYVKSILGERRGLWALINNAGILGESAPDDWLNVADYQEPLEVNCLGVARMTHAFMPMLKRERGRVITVTSVAGRYGFAKGGPYSVSKYAVEGYCDSIRLELEPFGVTVHILEPGFMATALTDPTIIVSKFKNRWSKLSKELKEEYGADYVSENEGKLHRQVWFMRSDRVDKVVNSYFHAITAKFPKNRYIIGVDSTIMIALLWNPTEMVDLVTHMMTYVVGFGTSLPAVCKKGGAKVKST